jgi:hypothetical protein
MESQHKNIASFLAIALFGRKRRDLKALFLNRVSAADPVSKASMPFAASLLRKIWPPTRANAINITAVLAMGAIIIAYNFKEKRTELSAKLMQRKREKALEGLNQLLDEANVIISEQEGLKSIVTVLCADQHVIKENPARSLLQLKDDVDNLIKETIAWHTEPRNEQQGAKLIGASYLTIYFVGELLKDSDFGLHAKRRFPEEFPNVISECEEEGESKSDDEHQMQVHSKQEKEKVTEEFSDEAKEKAEKLTKVAETVKTWPRPFQDWMKNSLKKGKAGMTELLKALVAHHSNKDKEKDGAKFPGTSEAVQAEIVRVCETGDFEARCKAQFPCLKGRQGTFFRQLPT